MPRTGHGQAVSGGDPSESGIPRRPDMNADPAGGETACQERHLTLAATPRSSGVRQDDAVTPREGGCSQLFPAVAASTARSSARANGLRRCGRPSPSRKESVSPRTVSPVLNTTRFAISG